MERRIFRSERRDRMGDVGPSPSPQGSRSFRAGDPSLRAAGDGTEQPAWAAAETALARQEFLAAANASNPLARALFERLAATLGAEELRGQAFRRLPLGDDPDQR
jgi:hypothetical protein